MSTPKNRLEAALNGQYIFDIKALLKETQFPHRFGNPEEYAQLAEHIINNTYLNGETIRLDSAMRMGPK